MEFDEAHLPAAVNIPRGLLELHADPASPVAHTKLTADRAGWSLVYGTKSPSARSLLAAQTLASMGTTASRCSTAAWSRGKRLACRSSAKLAGPDLDLSLAACSPPWTTSAC